MTRHTSPYEIYAKYVLETLYGERYGKLLLEMRHPVLREYLDRELEIRQNILAGLQGQTGERIRIRRMELEEELDYIWKGLEYYAV